jgi:hypothetical protein
MVEKGDLSLELIEARSKETFKEHKSTVDTIDAYVEIEPDSEYFLRVANDSLTETAICNISVDGKDLGYEFCLGPNEYDDKGLWKREENVSQHTALKVQKITAARATESGETPNATAGVITVTFHECIPEDGSDQHGNFKSDWNGDKVPNDNTRNATDDSKKAIHSNEGVYAEIAQNDDGTRNKYKYGKQIDSITLKYCTTVGLIAEKVLPEPPFWDYAKLCEPKIQSNSLVQKLDIVPKKIKRNTCDTDGKIMDTIEYDMFDLTEIDDDS